MDDGERTARGRVILTYGRSFQTLTAIRSLGRRGIDVVVGDEYALTCSALSRYTGAYFEYPPPGTDPEGFLDAIDRVIDEHRPPPGVPYVLMPVHRESPLLSRERARFEDRVRIPLASYESFRIAQHKGRLARYARELDVPIPRTWTPRSEEELYDACREMRFPVFLKLPAFASGKGVHRASDPRELRQLFREAVEEEQPSPENMPLVQEAAPGDDYCVTTLFDRGTLRAQMTYRNVLSWPRGAGAGVVRETVRAPEAERLAERLLRSLVWHGIAQVDFRWTGHPEDPPRLLEINPRFFAGMFQAVVSGVDYPWLLFRIAAGWDVQAPEPSYESRTEAPVTGLLATMREIAADEETMRRLSRLWHRARSEARDGHAWSAASSVLRGLGRVLDVEARMAHARSLLQAHEENLSVLFDQPDDPLPVLGLIFPVAVFLRHGKVSEELLIDADAHAAGS